MALADDITSYLTDLGAETNHKSGRGAAKLVLAEKKSFLSRKKVEYHAKFKVDESARTVHFFEMLKESGAGMSGGDLDDVGGGVGFRKETYRTGGGGGRAGGIEAQGSLLGQRYSFTSDFGQVRSAIEKIVQQQGYQFDYQLTPKGL